MLIIDYLLVILQKAIQENHISQSHQLKAAAHLIKTQGTSSVGDIAAEVAAEAVARSQHIQQETQKLAEKEIESHSKDDDSSPQGGEVIQDLEADVQDIRKRSIHHLDLSGRLPWLKGLGTEAQPRNIEEHGHDEQAHGDPECPTSPDSGVMDHLSEVTESLDGHTPIKSPPRSHKRLEEEEEILMPPPNLEDYQTPTHLQNGELAIPELPPKDYPILPPPKDYPTLEQHPDTMNDNKDTATIGEHLPLIRTAQSIKSNPAGDVYSVQEAKLRSRPFKVKAKADDGSLVSPLQSQEGDKRRGAMKEISRARNNILTDDDYYAHIQNGTLD